MLDQGVLGLRQDGDEGVLVQILKRGQNRQTTDEFRDQTELQQVFGFQILENLSHTAAVVVAHFGPKAHGRALAPLRDDPVQPGKGTAADEQDVGRVHLQEFLLRMFAPTLGRNGGDRAFHQLQQRLLHALARDVAGDRRVFRLARDLVDLVDIDDAALRLLDVVFAGLKQLENDVFDILPDIASLGQCCRVGHGEGHIEDPCQRLGQQGLAAARGTDQQDVGFRQFDVAALGRVVQPFVVIVHRDRQNPLGDLLTDHVIVQNVADFLRGRHPFGAFEARRLGLFTDDIHAKLDAFVTDEHGRAGNQLAHLVLALAAETTVERVLAVAARIVRHFTPFAPGQGSI